jgi:hypothetical protein
VLFIKVLLCVVISKCYELWYSIHLSSQLLAEGSLVFWGMMIIDGLKWPAWYPLQKTRYLRHNSLT